MNKGIKYLVVMLLAIGIAGGMFLMMGLQIQDQELALGADNSSTRGVRVMVSNPALCKEKARAIEVLLASSESCAANHDCELLSLGCPYGCLISRNRVATPGLKELASQRSGIGCIDCEYMCIPPREPIARCRGGKCVVDDLSRPSQEELLAIKANLNAGFEE